MSGPGGDQRSRLFETPQQLRDRAEVAWGRRDPDLVVRAGRLLLPTGEWVPREIGIVGDRIALVAEEVRAGSAPVVDFSGEVVVPGYVEPHCHLFGPLSVASYGGCALAHGVTTLVTDDTFLYTFLQPGDHRRILECARDLPLVLRWSLRADPPPRTVPLSDLAALLDLPDIEQLGELFTRPDLEHIQPDLAAAIVAARHRLVNVEGHSPGASARTLGAAAALGVTADHESMKTADLVERIRLGYWAFIRYNGELANLPAIVPGLLADGVPLDRVGLTVDTVMAPWIEDEGMLDAAIAAALECGMDPAEAYACSSWRPAAYMGVDAHLGIVAPGRLASFNVLADERSPRPLSTYSLGREVAREGRVTVEVPDAPWSEFEVPPWSVQLASAPPPLEIYGLRPEDPSIELAPPSRVKQVPGPARISCVGIDPATETFSRVGITNVPAAVGAVASTLTPKRILVGLGADPGVLKETIDAVIAAGGGIAYASERGIRTLPLPYGGAITDAPFEVVASFWRELQAHAVATGAAEALGDPILSLLYLGAESLPGPHFTSAGVVDSRAGQTLATARPMPSS